MTHSCLVSGEDDELSSEGRGGREEGISGLVMSLINQQSTSLRLDEYHRSYELNPLYINVYCELGLDTDAVMYKI